VWGQDLSTSVGGAGGVGGLLAVNHHDATSGNITHTYYVVRNDRGDTVALVDSGTSSTVAAFEYAPYGGLTVVDADENASTPSGVLPPSMANPASLCPMLFSSKYYDHEVGLYYYGYRYYRPETGTWLNRDPLAEQGGLNLYAMVGNDPMNAVDPLGLETLSEAVSDGVLSLGEIMDLNLTLTESYAIISSAPEKYRTIWTESNLTPRHRREADEAYSMLPVRWRYRAMAMDVNERKAKSILLFRHSAFQAYVKETYRLWRALNPVHFCAEKGYVIGSGREPILLEDASRIEAAGKVVLYLAIMKGASWSMSHLRGLALAPIGAQGTASGVTFAYPKGGRVTVAQGNTATPGQLEAAFRIASSNPKANIYIGRLPQGVEVQQFSHISSLLNKAVGEKGYEGDILIQGSRAAHTAKATSDLDVAIRVSEAEFNRIIQLRFANAKPGTAAYRTMDHAMTTGKIQRGEIGLSGTGKEVGKILGIRNVDISVIKSGGQFDNGVYIPVRETVIP
jgi:RHS repeat-associated protein